MPTPAPVHLKNPWLSVDIDPARGGAVTSLRALNREWLVAVAPRRAAVTATSSFIADPPSGWDEMAPTIVACTVDGVAYPDHGDAWRTAWIPDGDDGLVHRSAFGYTLRRRAELVGRALVLRYQLTSDRPRPVLWAAHPLVNAPDGTRVTLEDYDGQVLDVFAPGAPAIDWDPSLADPAGVPVGGYRKLVAPPQARISTARIVHPDGAWLRLAWDVSVAPHLAVYVERQAFSRQPCVAVEPMTGWYDSLSVAVDNGQVLTVGLEAPASWSLTVEVGPADRA